jgi:hypothetical protein
MQHFMATESYTLVDGYHLLPYEDTSLFMITYIYFCATEVCFHLVEY